MLLVFSGMVNSRLKWLVLSCVMLSGWLLCMCSCWLNLCSIVLLVVVFCFLLSVWKLLMFISMMFVCGLVFVLLLLLVNIWVRCFRKVVWLGRLVSWLCSVLKVIWCCSCCFWLMLVSELVMCSGLVVVLCVVMLCISS